MNKNDQMTEDIYRHSNGLKHINTINNDGFSALFVVNTPIFDNSGVAHAVEHMVFRGSTAFPEPETLFQLTSLTDAKINASTFAETTYFHCQSLCAHTFTLAINYLLNGLFDPTFDANDLLCEIHDGNNKGVIYQELMASEEADRKNTQEKDNLCYGGISTSIGDLSLNDLTAFHHCFYQATNITLITANADIDNISHLIALLPKQANQSKRSKEIKVAIDKYRKQSHAHAQENTQKKVPENESNQHHQKKYPQTINQLITLYHSWLHDPYYQEIDDYRYIESTNKPVASDIVNSPNFPQSTLISSLVTLSKKQVKETINEPAIETCFSIKKSINTTLLPNLFSKLYQQAKKQLTIKKSKNNTLVVNGLPKSELNFQINIACVNDQRNALWLMPIDAKDQILATITSYIISAYPKFLAPRCQGLCYATQALTIENSAYLAIYSAFDIDPSKRLKEVPLCLVTLSQDKHFISTSLVLAKIKYCQAYHLNYNQVLSISTTDISAYLQVCHTYSHPKV